MPPNDDQQDLEDDLIFITLLADEQANTDSGRGCGGCLATAVVLVAVLALLGAVVECLGPLLGAW